MERKGRSGKGDKVMSHLKKNCYAFKKKQQEQLTASNTTDVVEEV